MIDLLEIVKEDNDWDQGFFWELVHAKLSNLHEFFTSDATVTDWSEYQEDLDALKEAVEIAKYIYDEDFIQDGYEEFHTKYPVDDIYAGDLQSYLSREKSEEERRYFEKEREREMKTRVNT